MEMAKYDRRAEPGDEDEPTLRALAYLCRQVGSIRDSPRAQQGQF